MLNRGFGKAEPVKIARARKGTNYGRSPRTARVLRQAQRRGAGIVLRQQRLLHEVYAPQRL